MSVGELEISRISLIFLFREDDFGGINSLSDDGRLAARFLAEELAAETKGEMVVLRGPSPATSSFPDSLASFMIGSYSCPSSSTYSLSSCLWWRFFGQDEWLSDTSLSRSSSLLLSKLRFLRLNSFLAALSSLNCISE